MIDIIEAGKFYLECLNKVREQIVRDKIPQEDLFNDVAKCAYELFDVGTSLHEHQIIFSFVLNGIEFCDSVYVDKSAKPPDIIKIVSDKIGCIIAEKILAGHK